MVTLQNSLQNASFEGYLHDYDDIKLSSDKSAVVP